MSSIPVSSLDPALVDPEIQAILTELGRQAAWSVYDGPYLQNLAASLSDRFRRTYAQLCCSGTVAVELALRGCRIRTGDEVLLAAYDFPGNFRAVEAVGASIAIVDIPSSGWSFTDMDALEQAYSDQTKAIIVSHLHGTAASIAAICEWARTRKICVIEDACQVPGAVICGQPAGSWGDCSVFSFGGSKLLSSGRGGAVVTNDARIDQRMRIYRERGNDAFAMSELQAAVLGPQLQKLDTRHAQRAASVTAIERSLAHLNWIDFPQRSETIAETAFYKWGFRVKAGRTSAIELRDSVISIMDRLGVLAGSGFNGFGSRSKARCRRVGHLSNAQQAAQTTVLIHHTMLNETLSDHLVEVDRQLRDANLIDKR